MNNNISILSNGKIRFINLNKFLNFHFGSFCKQTLAFISEFFGISPKFIPNQFFIFATMNKSNNSFRTQNRVKSAEITDFHF